MNRSILGQVQKLIVSTQSQLAPSRSIHASAVCLKTSSGKYKITPKRDRPLTYEMANPPYQIATRKAWNSWNCANLQDGLRPCQTVVEDMFIRKFITGTFHSLVCSEVIIKRQFNHIRIAFLMRRGIAPNKVYFLIGYTEELLSSWMQCPITLEIQTIAKQEDTIFKYI
ncbi:28S ribosomal protein S24, mitochondrial [Sitodiplosis mosellana]|uniref:28S ribosomal protein S24, mitochondrial n=1 Tax=Sitodiplosis mosellana TaxID=263140 RepID=UPI0024450319|nr:28S ribosomal protein S24, mitochondrial [Sitodiplosis mosellana]